MDAWLTQAAAREGIGLDAILRDALLQRMRYDGWFVSQVQQGIAEVERGEFAEHGELETQIERWMTERRVR